MSEEADPVATAEELELVEEDDEALEPDTSAEAVAEADMSDTGPENIPVGAVEFEDEGDDEGVAR